MKKIVFFTMLCLLSISAVAQQRWDAISAKEAITMVLEDASSYGNLMSSKGYKLVNNIDTPTGGFVTVYSRNCTVNAIGDAISLGQGVSSIVAIDNEIDMPVQVMVVLFSTQNATKFRQQILDLGFKKTGTESGNVVVYQKPGYEFTIKEQKDKSGRFPATFFLFTE